MRYVRFPGGAVGEIPDPPEPLPSVPPNGLRVPAWFTYDSTSPIGGHIDIAPNVPPADAEKLAAKFHEAYERLAPSFGYETRKASAKPWADVPENNRRLMTAVCTEILFGVLTEEEAQHALDQIPDNQCGWPPRDCPVCDSLREKLRRLSQSDTGDTSV